MSGLGGLNQNSTGRVFIGGFQDWDDLISAESSSVKSDTTEISEDLTQSQAEGDVKCDEETNKKISALFRGKSLSCVKKSTTDYEFSSFQKFENGEKWKEIIDLAETQGLQIEKLTVSAFLLTKPKGYCTQNKIVNGIYLCGRELGKIRGRQDYGWIIPPKELNSKGLNMHTIYFLSRADMTQLLEKSRELIIANLSKNSDLWDTIESSGLDDVFTKPSENKQSTT